MNEQVVETVAQLYAQEGEGVASSRCAEDGLIASICMTCRAIYRIRSAAGAGGGLSHGWCSDVCAKAGAERAGFSQRRRGLT